METEASIAVDFRRLRYFVTVVEAGQITKAAELLHMAQPPLSQQLKQLEAELGVALFHRVKKRLELTPAGETLYRHAKRLLAEIDEIAISVRETEAGLRGTLSFGFAKTLFAWVAPVLRQFHALHPNVRFLLREGDTYVLTEMVKRREIEFALIRLPFEDGALDVRALPDEPYVLVAPASWKVPKRLSFRFLEDRPLVLLHRLSGRGQFELVVGECRRHGFEPKIVAESPDVHVLLALVEEEIGATVIPFGAAVRFKPNNATVATFDDAHIAAKAAIVWDPERYRSKAAVRFIELLEERFGAL
ncbi:MAG: Transcriptional regulator, LysR family [Hydrogenibacillus schlegelii]|uniref:Transcriptional regulator, LysR family n=1 Tax=Hydrogenibacillus schlegelii TaxID=1484 RepID=A0A2T5G6M3_HYDSH|nr:LysR family transcriptional regulator [Hydrogenibacillus schlegelii]PTQ51841.1 MAG: Transcriptional regulator, LysR family [Hydrogenibacillus schlegelii]